MQRYHATSVQSCRFKEGRMLVAVVRLRVESGKAQFFALPPKADNQTCSEQSKIMDCAERMTKRMHRPECQSRDHRIPRSHRSAGLAGKATSSPLQHCRALL